MAVMTGKFDFKQFGGVDRATPDHDLSPQLLRTRSNFAMEDKNVLTKCLGAKAIVSAGATSIGAIQQVYRYYYDAGEQTLVAASGKVARIAANIYASLGTGFSTSKIRNFYVFGNICFSVNDNDIIQHSESTGALSAAQYATPSSPVTATGSAGSLTGIYGYKLAYRYLHDTYNAGGISTSVTLSATKLDVTIPAVSSPILGTVVYRTRDMSTSPGTAAELFYLTYVTGTATSTYIDNGTDATLVIDESQLAGSLKIAAPTGQYGCVAQLRNIVGGGDNYPRRFYYSEFNKPYTFYASNFFEVDDDIVGLLEWNNDIYAIQKSEIARTQGIIGTNTVSLRRKLTPGLGGIAPRSITVTPAGIFFLANDRTVRLLDRYGTPHLISEPVEEYLEDAVAAYVDDAVGYFSNGRYYLWICTTGTSNNQGLVYDTKAKAWHTRNGVYPVAADVADKRSDTGEIYYSYGNYVYQGNTGTYIETMAGTTPAISTSAISSIALTGVYDLGEPHRQKQLLKVEVAWTGGDGTEYIELSSDRGGEKRRITLPVDTEGYTWGGTASRSTDFVWAEFATDNYGGTWGRSSSATKQQTFGIPSGLWGQNFQFKVVASGKTAFSLKRFRGSFWHYEV